MDHEPLVAMSRDTATVSRVASFAIVVRMGRALRALLVAVTKDATWTRSYELPIAPSVGLGIRLDTYDMVNVESVIVGDVGYDVTCIVGPERGRTLDAAWLERLGFEVGPYP